MSALVFAGWAPKRVVVAPAWVDVPGVTSIASASDCIADRPEGWIERFEHNRIGLYDTLAGARAVVPPADRALYDLFAFRVLETIFTEVGPRPFSLADLAAVEVGPLEPLGFDAVSSTLSSGFECSPLSCNGMARHHPVNERCLFRTLAEAVAGAEAFARGDCEPGPYFVVEVLRLVSP